MLSRAPGKLVSVSEFSRRVESFPPKSHWLRLGLVEALASRTPVSSLIACEAEAGLLFVQPTLTVRELHRVDSLHRHRVQTLSKYLQGQVEGETVF